MSEEEQKTATPVEDQGQDAENQLGAEVFDADKNNLVNESSEDAFKVKNPHNHQGHTAYDCEGVDKAGPWHGQRRYNEFFKLNEKLELRWPGLPLPILPPKKAIGNKDAKFINERRYFLERYLKKLSHFPCVIESKEFKLFSRPSADIEKMLNSLPKTQNYVEIVERMRLNLDIKEHMYDLLKKSELENESREFAHFAKQTIPILKSLQ